MKNEILEEIWTTRKEIEKEHGGGLRKVFKSMKKKTAASKRRVYNRFLRGKKTYSDKAHAYKDKKPSSSSF
jgi:hypothetical protein